MDSAFSYVHDHGLTTEDAYPYVGYDETCRGATVYVVDSSHYDVPGNNPDQMVAAVNRQPVSVGIEADQ